MKPPHIMQRFSPLIVKFVPACACPHADRQKWQKNFFIADKSLLNLNPNIEYRNSKQYRMTKIQISKRERVKLDAFVKNRNMHNFVIPVKTGIQSFQVFSPL